MVNFSLGLTGGQRDFQVLSNPEKRRIHDAAIGKQQTSPEKGETRVSIWFEFCTMRSTHVSHVTGHVACICQFCHRSDLPVNAVVW
jgi:hypothetical protein